MRIHAYILAADPTWIEHSVLSYYNYVDEIVVSFDRGKRGWTGTPIPVDECLARAKAVDRANKLRLVAGDFFRPSHAPIDNDTYQRQCALAEAGRGADWVLQLDSDEVLPNPLALIEMLKEAEMRKVAAVEWPMRVLFQRTRNRRFLEVCAANGSDRFEYPGPIAVRPDVKLFDARRAEGLFLRPVVGDGRTSLQTARPAEPNEIRVELKNPADAIIHNSWARDSGSIRTKIASWGHNAGWRSRLFYYLRWLPAPWVWRVMRNFHPFANGLWPALKLSDFVGISA